MKLPRPRKTERQLELFDDRKQLTFAALRNWCGDFYEEATAIASGGVRLKTDCRCLVCPDIRWRPTQKYFFEIKAVGDSGSPIIYRNRFEKDCQWLLETQSNSYYWFWRHRGSLRQFTNLTVLRQNLAHTTSKLIILEHSTVERIVRNREPRILNTSLIKNGDKAGDRLGYGCHSSGYGWGWAIPWGILEAACTEHQIFGLPVQVYGCTIPVIRVSSGNGVAEKFLL